MYREFTEIFVTRAVYREFSIYVYVCLHILTCFFVHFTRVLIKNRRAENSKALENTPGVIIFPYWVPGVIY